MAGDGILTIALAIEALRIDPSPTALSIVLTARLLPTVMLLIFGGAIVDRLPRKLSMLSSDLVRGLVVGIAAILIAVNLLTTPILLIMMVTFGIADSLFIPASTAIVPELVPEGDFDSASALTSTSRTITSNLLGPAVGGLIVSFLGIAWSFGLDALSFGISAVCLSLVHPIRKSVSPATTRYHFFQEIADGFRYTKSQRWIWVPIVVAGIANFAAFSPLAAEVPFLIRETFRGSATTLGFVEASGGLGGAIGALAIARYGAPRNRFRAMWFSWATATFAVAAMLVADNPFITGVLLFFSIGLVVYGNVLWEPLVQTAVPKDFIGRVSSLDWLASLSLSPLGLITAGFLIDVIGPRLTMFIGGTVGFIAVIIAVATHIPSPEMANTVSHSEAPTS